MGSHAGELEQQSSQRGVRDGGDGRHLKFSWHSTLHHQMLTLPKGFQRHWAAFVGQVQRLHPSSPISISASLQQPQLLGPQNMYWPSTAASRDTTGKGFRGVSLLSWQSSGMEDSTGHLHLLGEAGRSLGTTAPGHGSCAWPVQCKVTPRPVNPGRHRGDLLVTQLPYYVALIKKKKKRGGERA